jgi:chemotaxis protein CheZ
MMAHFEKEDLEELIKLMENIRQTAAVLSDESSRPETLEAVRQGLQSFHTTAAMLGMEVMEQSGLALQDFFASRIAAADPFDNGLVLPFVSTIKAILGEMEHSLAGNAEIAFEVGPIIEILHSIPASLTQDEVAGELTADEFPAELSPSDVGLAKTDGEQVPEVVSEPRDEILGDTDQIDLSALKSVTESLGGQLSMGSENGSPGSFLLSFSVSEANVKRIQSLLSTSDLKTTFATKLSQQESQQDVRVDKVLQVFEEFVAAFSAGELKRAQEILLSLAEQQQQAGLYKQVGVMARQLHDSLKGFADSLDPTLMDIVEDKIPDSGTRLEHILKLTENAANTTLDHVEAMQKRNQDQQTKLGGLKAMLHGMKAVGDRAKKLIGDSQSSLDDLQDSLSRTSEDLITVLTAQDYQDLTGQIIQKIIVLLKDLESNLVNVIRTFGVRPEGKKAVVEDELYGPAHAARTSSMHSQGDVDSLLADFGF